METGTLSIYRPKNYFAAARKLRVLVDGQDIGFVKNGTTALFELPVGPHSVYVAMDWCSCLPVTVNCTPDKVAKLAVSMPPLLPALIKCYTKASSFFELHPVW